MPTTILAKILLGDLYIIHSFDNNLEQFNAFRPEQFHTNTRIHMLFGLLYMDTLMTLYTHSGI